LARKSFLALVMSVMAATMFLAAPVAAAGGSGPAAWKLVWSDEFDGSTIDQSKWNFEVDCWGGGNEERQCYTNSRENSFIDDGALVIRAKRERVTGFALPSGQRTTVEKSRLSATKPFSSARMTTKNKGDWRFGRIEVRAMLPQGQGTWPAIWMMPSHDVYGPWAASGEIDIMEAVNLGVKCSSCIGGRENHVLGTLHYGATWPNNTYKSENTVMPGDLEAFHTYAIEWYPDQITWSVDGVAYATQTPATWHQGRKDSNVPLTAPFDQEFHLILNLAIGGHLAESRNLGSVSNAHFPKDMRVDWVRVYQCERANEPRACLNQAPNSLVN
jgi:beta-glucanase (GH16 family)